MCGTAAAASVVDRDAHQLRALTGERRHLPCRSADVGGVGVVIDCTTTGGRSADRDAGDVDSTERQGGAAAPLPVMSVSPLRRKLPEQRSRVNVAAACH